MSGRTAAYRTKLLKTLREQFLNEPFLSTHCMSGDDKRYTCLLLQAGYQTWNQLNAHVYSTFKPTFDGFTKQRVRWSRNSFRSDLRALWQGWVWRHAYLAILLVDQVDEYYQDGRSYLLASQGGWMEVLNAEVAHRADRNLINENTIEGSDFNGVYIKSGGNQIRNNAINGYGHGISIRCELRHGNISQNSSKVNESAMAGLEAPHDNIISGNTIAESSGAEIRLMGNGTDGMVIRDASLSICVR